MTGFGIVILTGVTVPDIIFIHATSLFYFTGATVVPEPMATGPSSAAASAAVAVAVQRPNTKRKRKFKRMAVDPNTATVAAVGASSSAPDATSAMEVIAAAAANSAGKRPKVRNR